MAPRFGARRAGAVPVGDGARTCAAIKMTKPEATFSLTLELQQDTGVSLVAAERVFQRAKTQRLFRLEIDGGTPTTNCG